MKEKEKISLPRGRVAVSLPKKDPVMFI